MAVIEVENDLKIQVSYFFVDEKCVSAAIG